MENERPEGVGDKNETTAVVERPQRPPIKKWKVVVSALLGLALVITAIMAGTCVATKPLRDKRAAIETQVEKMATDVATLQEQMGLTTARTSAVEVRTTNLEIITRMDRETAASLLESANKLREDLAKKADRTELKDYARTKRIAKVERKLDDYISSAEEATALPTRKITLRHVPTYVDVYRSRRKP